jgi:hexosaminidase
MKTRFSIDIYGMKAKIYWVFIVFITTFSSSCSAPGGENNSEKNTESGISKFNFIPKPVEVRPGNGYFRLASGIKINADPGNPEVNHIAGILSELAAKCGIRSRISSSESGNDIRLLLYAEPDNSLGEEGYILEIKKTGINISANKPAGLFYGVQSLFQLFPSKKGYRNKSFKIPCVVVKDYPRFTWRGLLFDAAHQYFGKESIMKYIDQMARYKYNVLQLHMTNDNAWRIEIQAFPRLNQIGSWRVPRTGIWGTFEQPQPGEKATAGGYYTKEDLKELVRYAHDRYVTIVPGIETPGHSLALIASYPSMSCTGKQYDVNPGSPRSREVPYAVCPGNDSVFYMLDKILTEYCEIFPGEYIHIGGDEVDKHFWEKCPKCRKRMTDEKLKNVEELQSYFIKRVEKILNSKGKKLIGWDEILEGGLAPEATVMSWRGMEGGITAARMNHHVVMTPTQYCYFDYGQTDSKIVPREKNWGLLRLSQVFKFEPVPESVDARYILGGQGNLWSEFIPNYRQMEYMTWPRGMALAEILWSPKAERNIDEFLSRMEDHFPLFDRNQVKYSRAVYDPIIIPERNSKGKIQISFSSEVKGLDIYYTFDGTLPDNFSPRFEDKPVEIPKGVTQIWVTTYRNGKPMGETLLITAEELANRLTPVKVN